MKILLLYTTIDSGNRYCYPHGFASICSVLKEAGHELSLVYLNDEISKEELLERVAELEPQLVATSAATNQWHHVRKYTEWIKERWPELPTVCGGIHPTFAPEDVLSSPGIDIACLGEGEGAVLDLASALEEGRDYSRIENLWVKKDGEIVRNPLRPLLEDLDQLPLPERELFDYETMLQEGNDIDEATLMAGRGCPFDCTYCCNRGLRGMYDGKGRYVRKRSVDNLLAEVDALLKRYPRIKTLHFEDDIFTIDPRWVKEFCESYKKRFSLPFRIYLRVDTVRRKTLKLLKKAGCFKANIGVESGNEQLRKKILNRHMSNKNIIRVFDVFNKFDMFSFAFIIIGLPDETPEMIEDSMSLVTRIVPDHTQISVYYPYPGTELRRICEEQGLMTDGVKSTFFGGNSTLTLKSITKERLNQYYEDFWALSFRLGAAKQRRFVRFLLKVPVIRRFVGRAIVFLSRFKRQPA